MKKTFIIELKMRLFSTSLKINFSSDLIIVCITKKASPFLKKLLGRRRDSNPRPSVPQTDALTN